MNSPLWIPTEFRFLFVTHGKSFHFNEQTETALSEYKLDDKRKIFYLSETILVMVVLRAIGPLLMYNSHPHPHPPLSLSLSLGISLLFSHHLCN